MTKELSILSATEIGKAVNVGELRPTEVVKYFLERIHELNNPGLNAFVYTKDDEALEAAAALEKRLEAGENVGPFAGVPFALKDFLPSKEGWTNTHGGVKSLEAVDPYSSVFCKAMEKAGGIAIGKTNAPAYGFRGTTDNKLYGPTHNPNNYLRNAGGSSGGSAAAVAAGLVPIAEGGDAGGSIRIPAAWCGCYGFKASAGLIPNVCRPDAWIATHVYCTPGGLTKTVEDAEILFEYMRGYDPRDPYSQCHAGLMGSPDLVKLENLKIAVTFDFGIFGDVDPEIEQRVFDVAQRLITLGAKVSFVPNIIKNQSLADLTVAWCQAISIDSTIELVHNVVSPDPKDLPVEFLSWKKDVESLTLEDFYKINKIKTGVWDDFCNVFEKYDVILSPVTVCLPVENAKEKGETKGPEGELIEFAETFLYNFTGNPAASVPVGYSKDGLPIGVQVASYRFGDDIVLGVSRIIEKLYN